MEEALGDDQGDRPSPDDPPVEAAGPSAGGEVAPRVPRASASSAPVSRCSSPLARIRQAGHARSNSFQRWRWHMQRAWRWGPGGGGSGLGGGSREQSVRATINFEMMANQKRQWYQIKAKSRVPSRLSSSF